jgi:hypothetical protein
MVVTVRLLVLWCLAQFASCASVFCGVFDRPPFPTATTRISRTSDFEALIGAELLAPGEWLLIGTRDKARVLLRFHEDDGITPLTGLSAQISGEGGAVDDGAWWYAIAGGLGKQWGVTFVREDESQTRTVALPFASTSRFVSVLGPTPCGLYFYVDSGDGTTRAIEVTPDGVRHRWTLAGHNVITGRDFPIAVRRMDESIALVRASEEGVTLHVLAAKTEPEEFVLSEQRGSRYAAAADHNDLLIVGETRKHVRAIHVDLMKPDHAETMWLSGENEGASFPAVAATGAGFAVAWLNDEAKMLRARTIANGRPALLPTDVGPMTRRGETRPFFAMRQSGEALVFIWDRGDDIVTRALPDSSSGAALLTTIEARFCRNRR